MAGYDPPRHPHRAHHLARPLPYAAAGWELYDLDADIGESTNRITSIADHHAVLSWMVVHGLEGLEANYPRNVTTLAEEPPVPLVTPNDDQDGDGRSDLDETVEGTDLGDPQANFNPIPRLDVCLFAFHRCVAAVIVSCVQLMALNGELLAIADIEVQLASGRTVDRSDDRKASGEPDLLIGIRTGGFRVILRDDPVGDQAAPHFGDHLDADDFLGIHDILDALDSGVGLGGRFVDHHKGTIPCLAELADREDTGGFLVVVSRNAPNPCS